MPTERTALYSAPSRYQVFAYVIFCVPSESHGQPWPVQSYALVADQAVPSNTAE